MNRVEFSLQYLVETMTCTLCKWMTYIRDVHVCVFYTGV